MCTAISARGFSNSAYEACLCFELKQAGLGYQRQVALPIVYKDVRLDCGYRMDIVVQNELIIDIKANGSDTSGA